MLTLEVQQAISTTAEHMECKCIWVKKRVIHLFKWCGHYTGTANMPIYWRSGRYWCKCL